MAHGVNRDDQHIKVLRMQEIIGGNHMLGVVGWDRKMGEFVPEWDEHKERSTGRGEWGTRPQGWADLIGQSAGLGQCGRRAMSSWCTGTTGIQSHIQLHMLSHVVAYLSASVLIVPTWCILGGRSPCCLNLFPLSVH